MKKLNKKMIFKILEGIWKEVGDKGWVSSKRLSAMKSYVLYRGGDKFEGGLRAALSQLKCLGFIELEERVSEAERTGPKMANIKLTSDGREFLEKYNKEMFDARQ